MNPKKVSVKKIPEILVLEMRREMDARMISKSDQVHWFKWLRYYLDFCDRYQYATRDPETELLFLQKLSSKGQSDAQQRQASDCISLFREVAHRFPAKGKEQEQAPELTDSPSTRNSLRMWGKRWGKSGSQSGSGSESIFKPVMKIRSRPVYYCHSMLKQLFL